MHHEREFLWLVYRRRVCKHWWVGHVAIPDYIDFTESLYLAIQCLT